jgi:hypothetical protein
MKNQASCCPLLNNKKWAVTVFIDFLTNCTYDFSIFGQKKWSKAHFQKQKWPQKTSQLRAFLAFCPLSHFFSYLIVIKSFNNIYK